MEERVGQAVATGKAEAEKIQQAGGSQVMFKSYTPLVLYIQIVHGSYTTRCSLHSHMYCVVLLLQVCLTNVLDCDRCLVFVRALL